MSVMLARTPLLAAIASLAFAAPSGAASAPRVSAFSVSPSSFATAAPGKRATVLRFRLSRAATVRITIARGFDGRYVRRGTLKRHFRDGRITLGFSGNVAGRRLKPGGYRATIVATDARGHRSAARSARFTVTPAGSGAPGTPAPQPTPGAPAPAGFPTPASTGVPAGWTPAQVRTTDLVVTQPGTVVQDLLLQNASIIVRAPNVTIRRVDLQGGSITNFNGNPCQGGMVVEDTTIEPPPGEQYSIETEGVIEASGYTARRVKIWRRSEGFRSEEDCGGVRIEDSFAKIVIPPGRCDLHSDGIQGYGGAWTTVVNTTIDFNEASCGTAPYFMPKNQGNTGTTIDRMLVMGGGYPFRNGVPGTVSGLKIVKDSWVFGPIDVACSLLSSWDAAIVTITPDYQVASTVKAQPCNTETGD
jgi:hypothetical protein